MIDLTSILEAVIALTIVIITAFIIPWVKSKTTAQEREDLLVWVDIAVAAAQQLFHMMDGSERLEYALSMLEEKGFDIDNGIVRDAVEAAVLKLHQKMKANEGAPSKTQRSGFVGERTSSGVNELSPASGSEGYGDCEDDNDG